MTRARDLADSADKDISGTLVLDDITLSNDISIADNGKAKFGDGDDLQIYHSGSSNIIRSVGGNTSVFITPSGSGGVSITNSSSQNIFTQDGDSAYLSFGGSHRLITTSTGVDVTGTVTADGLVVDGGATSSQNTITGSRAGTIALIANTSTATSHGLRVETTSTSANSTPLWLKSGGSDRLKVASNGDISFYEDTGTTAKLTWDASEEKLTSPSVDLTAIATDISDTAVDVFVYDTSKDSDGGAWRKRTQGTSWYNETLNTSTRGSRKEFPAVAVIVAEATKVTIYDGDDPAMPMWMEFQRNTGDILDFNQGTGLGGSTITAVKALNGTVFVGMGDNGNGQSVRFIEFTSDTAYRISDSARGGKRGYNGNIEQRNDGKNGYTIDSSISLVNLSVNDVAMTVLPNAPIDSATGLPIPTIAVATDGGVSVIKDDGSVVDIKVTSTMTGSNSVYFLPDNRIAFNAQQSSVSPNYYRYCIAPIPSSDVSNQAYWQSYSDDVVKDYAYSNYTGEIPLFPNVGLGANITAVEKVANDHAIGGPQSLSLLSESSKDNSSKDLFAYITSDYNTGWMNGDIKLAALSDTDDTDVVGTELVTNGTFDSDVSGWTAGNGAALAVVSGELRVTANGTNNPLALQSISTVVGETYVISATARKGTCTADVRVDISGITGAGSSSSTSNTTISQTFTASSTTHLAEVYIGGATVNGHTAYFDNISVRLADTDRSVNANGLQVHGTITKTPVATGADLVAYSGFSGSNYLQQPYNSDLEVGANPLCVMGWVKRGSSTSQQTLMQRDRLGDNVGSGSLEIGISTDQKLFVQTYSPQYINYSTNTLGADEWVFLCAITNSSKQHLYINGKLHGSGASIPLSTGGEDVVVFGVRTNFSSAPATTASLALWRISATAPTADQIKTIYEAEKPLFQENAQATLYGTSDAVTALAYDDTTELLHAGTSAGRSVFQGLRRVDNTTTAVGAAISASNGLVVED